MPVDVFFGLFLVPACVAHSSSLATALPSSGARWMRLSLPVLSCGCATICNYFSHVITCALNSKHRKLQIMIDFMWNIGIFLGFMRKTC